MRRAGGLRAVAQARLGTPRWLVVLALATAASAAGCRDGEVAPSAGPAQTHAARCEERAPVVDAALLAFLSKARSSHLEADLAETDAEPARAIDVLDRLVRSQAPGGERPTPEVREVLADTLARLADLRSQRGVFEAAEADVRRGLELAVERTHFRGRLFEIRGALEKRRFEALRAKGDDAGARAAKERSLAALRESVAIQEEVILGAVGAGGSAEPR